MELLKTASYNSQICRRKSPVNLTSQDNHLFQQEYLRNIGDCLIESHERCIIFDSTLSVHTDEKIYQKQLKNLISGNIGRRLAANRMVRYFLASLQPVTLIETGCWVIDEWAQGYFHWMTESLSKIELLRSVSDLNSILLPSSLRRYHFIEESLNYLAIPYLYLSETRFTECKHLTTVNLNFPAGNFNCHLLKRVARRFREQVKVDNNRGRRIWISRSEARFRNIVNEPALKPILDRHGFEIFQMERYSLADQIELMQQSSVIAGLHGAGLTNMLFLPTNSSVIEIRRRDDSHNNCYFSMASALDLDYYYLLADPMSDNMHNGNCYLDLHQLDRLLTTLG